MAYKKAELEELAISAIEEHNLPFINSVVCFLPCSEKTFFNWKLHELQSIKDALMVNKIKTKMKLRKNWESDMASATVQIALYKLLADDDELNALNGETTVVVNNTPSITVDWTK